MDNINGIILVNKPKDWTSQDVLSKLKRYFHVDKIGHAGTLDPLATGLLVVLLGSSTKLSDYLLSDEKEYECEILIGTATDTEDITGNVLDEKEVSNIENIDEVLQGLVGTLEQEPPMYSSVRYQGRKLYELAREGITVERTKRAIEIRRIERTSELEYINNKCKFKFKASVSKGTYIRTLCVEIGNRTNYPALMNNLNRTQSGKYKLVDAYDLQDILNGNYEILSNYSAICNKENIVKINDYLYNRVLNGMKIRVESNYDYIYLVHNEELVGIYEKDPTYSQENKSYKAKRVWN
jgi:tRNA pseudouridine55 synthase